MAIVAYIEVKYNGEDEWVYGGEFIRDRDKEFIFAPRIYVTDDFMISDISYYMRVHANPARFNLSLDVLGDIVDNNLSLESGKAFVASYDAISTAHSLFEITGFAYHSNKTVELVNMINDLYDTMMDRLLWNYENEYRVVFIENPNC